jgi:hypothetical protein
LDFRIFKLNYAFDNLLWYTDPRGMAPKAGPDLQPVTVVAKKTNCRTCSPPSATTVDYDALGKQLGVSPAAVYAVSSVESSGSGFTKSGKVVIRFEGHQFRKTMRNKGFDIDWLLIEGYSDIIEYIGKKIIDGWIRKSELSPVSGNKQPRLCGSAGALTSHARALFGARGLHRDRIG